MILSLTNKTRQRFKADLFGRGWLHMGTAEMPALNMGGKVYPERTFMVLMREDTGDVYIEEFNRVRCAFEHIEDQKLWNDLFFLFHENGIIVEAVNGGWEADEKLTQSFKAQSN